MQPVKRREGASGARQAAVPDSNVASQGSDALRHEFPEALGARLVSARPNPRELPKELAEREFTAKIKLKMAVRKQSGGCG